MNGPREVSFTRTIASRNSGAERTSRIAERVTSKARLPNKSSASIFGRKVGQSARSPPTWLIHEIVWSSIGQLRWHRKGRPIVGPNEGMIAIRPEARSGLRPPPGSGTGSFAVPARRGGGREAGAAAGPARLMNEVWDWHQISWSFGVTI